MQSSANTVTAKHQQKRDEIPRTDPNGVAKQSPGLVAFLRPTLGIRVAQGINPEGVVYCARYATPSGLALLCVLTQGRSQKTRPTLGSAPRPRWGREKC